MYLSSSMKELVGGKGMWEKGGRVLRRATQVRLGIRNFCYIFAFSNNSVFAHPFLILTVILIGGIVFSIICEEWELRSN